MGRGRIPMELIQKEKARKTTFQKRKSGLMKKVYEFSTLCGVDVCVIIYAPNFEGQLGLAEPETWPEDKREVQRIIQKFYNTTSDRRPKIYDVQEYYKERMKKVEVEISKVRKEMLKIMYPTWHDSFNALGEEELRMFASMLDAKLDACNQKMNILKEGDDLKGKAAIADQSEIKVEQIFTPTYLASNPNSSHFNLMQNNMPQIQQLFPPPPMNTKSSISTDSIAFWPFQYGGQSSQPSMLHFGQNETTTDWVNYQVCADPKISMVINEDEAENNNHNSSSPYYYNGNTQQTMQSYPNIALQTFPSQTLLNLPPGFQTLSSNLPPHGFQLGGFYDTNIFQPHVFNYMHGRK